MENPRYFTRSEPDAQPTVHFTHETFVDPNQDPSFFAEIGDAERLEAFQRGEFHYLALRVLAHIEVPVGRTTWVRYTIESPGIFGIESDCGDDHLEELAAEEEARIKADLVSMRRLPIDEEGEPSAS